MAAAGHHRPVAGAVVAQLGGDALRRGVLRQHELVGRVVGARVVVAADAVGQVELAEAAERMAEEERRRGGAALDVLGWHLFVVAEDLVGAVDEEAEQIDAGVPLAAEQARLGVVGGEERTGGEQVHLIAGLHEVERQVVDARRAAAGSRATRPRTRRRRRTGGRRPSPSRPRDRPSRRCAGSACPGRCRAPWCARTPTPPGGWR